MPDDKQEPTQETPGGTTIPIPTRKDVFRDLEKIAKQRKPSDDSVGGSEDEQ